jgi:FAD/FMN-containing dehydrogenase/SAM-dependent methyltransferase
MSLFQTLRDSLPQLGRFTARPASMIDQSYLEEPRGFLAKSYNFLKIRLIYSLLFLPLAIVDLGVSFVVGLCYALSSFFTSDAQQAHRIEQQKKYATIFSKNFYALLASVFGLISPKLIAFYFTPERKRPSGVHAGGGYHHHPDALISEPQDIEELRNAVKQAATEGYKIMPIGAGRSQGKQFLPDGTKAMVIDLNHFNSVEIHVEEKVAIVGAGARWSDIQLKADPLKLALKVMQASNVFSVGGSIGTNIHGWDHIDGVLSNTILSMDVMSAEGVITTITPEDKLFHLITGGLGLYGIIVSVKLSLTDNEPLLEKGTDVAPQEYVNYFHSTVQSNPNTRMHLYRLSLDPSNLLGNGVAVSFDLATQDAKPMITEHLSVEENTGTRFNRVMINLARRLEWVRRKYWNDERRRLLTNDGVTMTTNEVMQPVINAMFNPSISEAEWLQEYFIPGDQLDKFLAELGKLLMDNQVVLLNASVRFVRQHSASPLSYAEKGDRFAVVLCFNQSLQETRLIEAKKWLRESQKLTIKHGGSYYLPYQHVSSPEDFKASYPRYEEAQCAKADVDPTGLFTSGFYDKYLARKSTKINHFKEIMATDASKKEFAGFLNIVLKRVDSDKFFTLLEDILKYNDSHEEIYQELCKRLPEIMPSTFGGLGRILDSLSAIKEDLTTQAQELLPQDLKVINGLVEIGYPGRFVAGFHKHYEVRGKIVAMYEGPSLTDYIQTGFPRPYDQFEKIDYQKPNLANLADNSADVITCYVGLHHFPPKEMDAFLKDIRRVLREDGHFLLVDHDVIDAKAMSMAHMAHMIFNAVNGVSLEEEMNELRNFQPMSYWQERLAANGLDFAPEGPEVSMIREGDPSRNRMVSFAKKTPVVSATKTRASINPFSTEAEESNVPAWRERAAKRASSSRDTFFRTPTEIEATNIDPSADRSLTPR